MRAIYEVGEEVIVVTGHSSEAKFDGKEATITWVEDGEILEPCLDCGSAAAAYRLDIGHPGTLDGAWCECALRKKHQPGMGFEELMSELKIKEGA